MKQEQWSFNTKLSEKKEELLEIKNVIKDIINSKKKCGKNIKKIFQYSKKTKQCESEKNTWEN